MKKFIAITLAALLAGCASRPYSPPVEHPKPPAAIFPYQVFR